MTKTILFFYGTRPEIIKLAPVILEFKKQASYDIKTCHTGQHADLTLELEKIFNIEVDYRLAIDNNKKDLNSNLSEILAKANDLLIDIKPDLAVIQGDTTTVMAVALASFNLGIKVAHIEAGLRSFNLKEPFPEELNRKIATLCTEFHFAPTYRSLENLVREGILKDKIWKTGNTVIDALVYVKELLQIKVSNEKIILVTAHRRENHGSPLEDICDALINLSKEFDDYEFIWPIHPNPNVSGFVKNKLKGFSNIKIVPPLGYDKLVNLMAKCTLIWSDSGGIQEEAPYFKKPIIILRNVTERPEVVESGFGILTGTNKSKIEHETRKLLLNKDLQNKFNSFTNPFGDGTASKQILDIIREKL
ncbi:UDP-N-acetylglucosamine 2-epimerase [compost metagenome]